MRKQLFNRLFISAALGLCLTLAGCGGDNQTSTNAGVSVAMPPSAAPAESTINFPKTRDSFLIKRTSTSYAVTDKGIAGTVTSLQTSQTSIKFTDFTVSLLAGDKSKTIAAADLNSLIELYIAFFNRVPDAEGMIYWISEIKAGKTIEQLADNFYSAAITLTEVTGYSDSMSNSDFVKKIYKNVLGRDEVDQEGLNYWTTELNRGSKTRGNLIRTIVGVAHGFKGDSQYGWVADLLDNKVTIGTYFSIQQGLNYNTPTESITKGVAIAAAVTPTDISSAKNLIGVNDSQFDLRNAAPAPQVSINTSVGNVIVELNPSKAPITVANFLRYTDVGFYSNKIFHRVISNFMIQGGGFTVDMIQASTYAPIQLEVNNGLSNVRGTIAMARTSVLNSATSQFFINVVDNVFLDTSGGGYAVFGQVISGMDIVDKIKVVSTTTKSGYADVPVTPIIITSVTRVN
ncbi:peptidylprolyl isomerase [Undibacterium fentianense]|uniref:peptidylprolyl isomerase n=1 Tax=Undibacterium fentianense TaxID=2828728 RepID=A0A941DYK2_9BURK|nr:peptidylprolyl isomerase [Undibacterium fentianense]